MTTNTGYEYKVLPLLIAKTYNFKATVINIGILIA